LHLAETGCVIEYDLFGIETTLFPFGDFFLPNDGMRLDAIRGLIRAGHLEQIVVSQDIYTRGRQTEFGGHGYGHIMRNVVPIMRRKGFSEDAIDTILVRTPARLLTFV
jgi:phosphotriesterase-related protein